MSYICLMNDVMNSYLMLFLISAICVFLTPSISEAQTSRFEQYNLKYGITIKIPKHWKILESQLMAQIDTNTEIITGIGQGNNDILIAANYYDNNTSSSAAATVRVSLRLKQTSSQSDIAKMPQSELDNQAEQGYQIAIAALEKSGDKTTKITPYRITKDNISGYIAIRADYQEIGISHKKNISIYSIFLGNKVIKVTMSYDDAQGSILASTINEIKNSVTIN